MVLAPLPGMSVRVVSKVLLPVFLTYRHFVIAGPLLVEVAEASVTCWLPAATVGLVGFNGFLVAKVTSSIFPVSGQSES